MTLEIDPDAVLWNTPVGERDGHPLLVVMHGRGSTEHDLFALADDLPADYVIASVRALVAEGGGWSWWTAGGANASGDPDPESVDTATEAVTTWLNALPFTPSSVGTLGFSQGGVMSVHLLRRHPARIAFAVNLAGFLVRGEQASDALLAASRPPVFWGRGAADGLFTAEVVERTQSWLEQHTALDAHVYDRLGHTISRAELDDVVAFLRGRLSSSPLAL